MGDNGRQDHFRAQEADHANQHPPHMKGDNRRQRETRPLQSPRWRPHQPTPTPHIKGDTRRQWETTGDKTTSEPKKPTTPTNTHPPHEGRQPETMGDNGRQDHFRAQEADHTNQHPTPYMKGDNRRQWETTGDKTTSEPKKPTTPTNTKAARSKVALRTPTVNCLGKKYYTRGRDLDMKKSGSISNLEIA